MGIDLWAAAPNPSPAPHLCAAEKGLRAGGPGTDGNAERTQHRRAAPEGRGVRTTTQEPRPALSGVRRRTQPQLPPPARSWLVQSGGTLYRSRSDLTPRDRAGEPVSRGLAAANHGAPCEQPIGGAVSLVVALRGGCAVGAGRDPGRIQASVPARLSLPPSVPQPPRRAGRCSPRALSSRRSMRPATGTSPLSPRQTPKVSAGPRLGPLPPSREKGSARPAGSGRLPCR